MGLQIMGLDLLALQEWLKVGGLGLMLMLMTSQMLILVSCQLVMRNLLLILGLLLLLCLAIDVHIELLPGQVRRLPGLENRDRLEQGVLRGRGGQGGAGQGGDCAVSSPVAAEHIRVVRAWRGGGRGGGGGVLHVGGGG